MTRDDLRTLAQNPRLIEAARLAIEDKLVERRDARIGIAGRGNGLVIREYDGTDSSIIRMTTPEAIILALETIADSLF